MATIKICEYITLFQPEAHTSTSYQFYIGSTGKVIDENLKDTKNLMSWNSGLQKAPGVNDHHYELTDLRARVNLHFGSQESGWIELAEYNQLDPKQRVNSCKDTDFTDKNGVYLKPDIVPNY